MKPISETPILITGLPRSGTSMTAGILTKLGVFTGRTVPGDGSNEKGYFENTVIREQIIKGVLKAGGFDPLGIEFLPPHDFNAEISFDGNASLKNILLRILNEQGYSLNSPWLYKDPKLALLWRIFNSQFPDALWIIVRRSRENFIRSCLGTDFMVQHSAEEDFWNNYANAIELRLEELIKTVNRVVEIDTDTIIDGDFSVIETVCEKVGIDFSQNITAKFVSPDHWNQTPTNQQLQSVINLFNDGQLNNALDCAKRLLHEFPNSSVIYNICGAIYKKTAQLDESLKAYTKALEISPNYAEAHYNMGNVFKAQGESEEAIKCYAKAISIKHDYADAFMNMGAALKGQGELDRAIEAFANSLAIEPNNVAAHYNMGNSFKEQGKLEEAITSYAKAIDIKADYTDAHYNMGNAFKEQDKLDEAIEAYKRAIVIKPNHAEANLNMANALRDNGKLDAAIDGYNRALRIDPDCADAHHNMSFTLLANKDFDRGFKEYEWRWNVKKPAGEFMQSTKPMWNGETGQTVLVWGEQGIGDQIMFSSMISELHSISARIIVKCDKRLIRLFERSFPSDIKYFPNNQKIPDNLYDFHIPIGSLCRIFRKSLENFNETAAGYLKGDMARKEAIKSKLKCESEKKMIGISWKTASTNRNASARNINLADLANALHHSKIQLLSLQYGDVSDEIEAVKTDFGIDVVQFDEVDNNYDIDGLASLILACDQIVSTTNATVHLAGALGAKVTALLPFAPRWIWGNGSESFLYESVFPLQQKYRHNWNNVLDILRSKTYSSF